MNNQNNETQLSQNLQKQVYAEQIQLLYSSMSAAVAANIVTSILFISIQWSIIDKATLLVWFSISFVVIFLRAILLIAYKKASPNTDEIHQWGKLFFIGSTASGLILGSAGIFLFPASEPVYQLACTFVLVGMTFGAMTSLSFGKYNFLVYAGLALTPLLISLAIENTQLTLILVPMVLLSFFFAIKSSNVIYHNTQQNIFLRLKASEKEQELLKAQKRHELHIQRTPLGVIEWDADFKVKEWNHSAEKIFGYSKEEAVGQYAKDLIIPNEETDNVEELWSQLINAKGGIHFENKNITKDGATIFAEWFNTTLINDEGVMIGVTSLVQDVSERKRIEKMKSEFVSTVSHELRTPLTAIQGSVAIILGGAVGEVPQKISEMLELTKSNTNRLLLLINDILDIKKIESGELDFNFCKIEIMPLIEQAVNENKTYASQCEVQFEITDRLDKEHVYIDILRFSQAISNLLSNAAKFSHQGKTVEIKVFQKENFVRIEIIDSGIGISKKFLGKIFERFTQQDSSDTRSIGGTGLGLSITKTIIEKFKGKIGVISEEGKGSTFFIELPLAED